MLIAALCAHLILGGREISMWSALILLALTSIASLYLLNKSDDPVRIVGTIFLFQNTVHFVLGSNSGSPYLMFFSHVCGGFLSYQLITYFERELPAISDLFLYALNLQIFYIAEIPMLLQLRVSGSEDKNRSRLFLHDKSSRSPPAF